MLKKKKFSEWVIILIVFSVYIYLSQPKIKLIVLKYYSKKAYIAVKI